MAVSGRQQVQARAGVAQFARPDAERGGGVVGRPGGGDVQGQGQPGAQRDQFVGLVRLLRDGCGPQAAGEQFAGLLRGEHVERERHGAVQGDQAGEPVPAGDHHQAGVRAGQQRADLLRLADVVEDDQRPGAGQSAAQEGESTVLVGGDAGGGDAERVQEAAGHVGGVDRCPGRVEAAQVGEELPVGEVVGHPVGEVHGERGLADPRGAGDRRDDDRTAAGGPVGQELVERPELSAAAGEVPDGHR